MGRQRDVDAATNDGWDADDTYRSIAAHRAVRITELVRDLEAHRRTNASLTSTLGAERAERAVLRSRLVSQKQQLTRTDERLRQARERVRRLRARIKDLESDREVLVSRRAVRAAVRVADTVGQLTRVRRRVR